MRTPATEMGFSLGEGFVIGGRVATGASGIGLLLTVGYALSGDIEADIPITRVGTKDKQDNGPIFLHYTDNLGYLGIMQGQKILPNSKGKVYLTTEMFSAAEAFQNLFLGQQTHTGRGDYVIAFRLSSNKIAQLKSSFSDPYELIYPNGTLKLDKIIYGGVNLFQKNGNK